MIGKTLAHYEITGLLGKGGMGEVYRGRDTTLGREVAIKVLPQAFVEASDRLNRFEREAKLLASLNHPSIAAIYGLHHEGGVHFLAMELVPGEDLGARLGRGPIPLADALDVAIQVAAGLDAAHERGVVHRDIKPSNILVTPVGDAKILDFGLARASDDKRDDGSGALSQSPTLDSPVATVEGVILGTAGYMSPEQARGKAVDRRTDVWAFGAVLFEMLSGVRVFDSETVSDAIASILRAEPDWSKLPDETPPRLRELLERCLAKDPRRRLRDMGDVRLELEWVREGKSVAREAQGGTARRGYNLPVVLGAAVIGALLGAFVMSLDDGPGRETGPTEVPRLDLVTPEDLEVRSVEVSPDGQTIAMAGRPRNPKDPENDVTGVNVRGLDDYDTRLVPGSRNFLHFAFSADGQWMAIVAPEDPNSTRRFLWKVPVDGSAPPLKLGDWDDQWQGLHWLPGGDLIVGNGSRELVRLHTDGRPPEAPIPIHAEFDIESTLDPRTPQSSRLPGGQLLCSVEEWGERGYRQNVVALDVETGEALVILEDGANARWSDTGHVLFSRRNTLLAVPFDPDRLVPTSGPVALTDDLRIDLSWMNGGFDLAGDGTLLYWPGGFVGGRRRLEWLNSNLETVGLWSEETMAFERGPLLSPDGRQFMMGIAGADGVYDVWISETNRPVLQLWLEEPNRDCVAQVWSPDGSQLVYLSRTTDVSRHLLKSTTTNDPPIVLVEDDSAEDWYRFVSFADDGKTLLMTHFGSHGNRIAMIDLDGDARGGFEVRPVLENAQMGAMSPDGRWMLSRSDASGRWEHYLRRWRGSGDLGPAMRVSTDGGSEGAWWYTPAIGEPAEIWYLNDQKVFSVELSERGELSSPSFVADWKPRYMQMATFPDGRILMRSRGEGEIPGRYVRFLPGWTHELDRRMAVEN